MFEIFDLDKNSFITETELKEVMAKLGEHCDSFGTDKSYFAIYQQEAVPNAIFVAEQLF